MLEKKTSYGSKGKAYPVAVSIGMIVVAIILSFVDLAFLNDVIGQILGVGANESLAMAFVLGLVGITIMGHQGLKESQGGEKKSSVISHYALWISLGLALVLMRLFSASILDLDSSEEESLMQLGPLGFRLVDLVISPLMMLLYIATGLMVKDGMKNLLLNPEFDKGWKAWWAARKAAKLAEKERAAAAEKERTKEREEALARQAAAAQEAEEAKAKAGTAQALAAEQARLVRIYNEAEARYQEKRTKVEADFEKISTNISFIESIDKKQRDFEGKTIPGLMKIIQSSIMVVQHNAASAVHKKYGIDITSLRGAIERYNRARDAEHAGASIPSATEAPILRKKVVVSDASPRNGRFIQ